MAGEERGRGNGNRGLSEGPLPFRIEFLPEIDSTNQELIRRAEQGERSGLALVADFQSKGRGRLGRSWEAGANSSLLVSVLLQLELAPERLGLVPILTGVAMAEAIREISGFQPGLVWPNDLHGAKGKVAGILVESVFQESELKALVIGVGVNLSQGRDDFDPEIRDRASSIYLESGKKILRENLLVKYLDRLGFWLDALGKNRVPEMVDKYSEFDIISGKEIRVRGEKGQISGMALGIDQTGRLRVRSLGKELIFSAGEVIMVRGS